LAVLRLFSNILLNIKILKFKFDYNLQHYFTISLVNIHNFVIDLSIRLEISKLLSITPLTKYAQTAKIYKN
jgi:hypothetical protein